MCCACADPWPLGPAAKRPGPVPSRTQYAMLGEMGGMGTFVPGHTWAPPTSALNKGCFSYGHAFANTTEGEEQVYVSALRILLEMAAMANYSRCP